MENIKISSASVKVMLSHDYCHFEVSKSSDEDLTDEQINGMRKDVQRLAVEAVRQYQVAKNMQSKRIDLMHEYNNLQREVELIKTSVPEKDRSASQKAKIKALVDKDYWNQHKYEYDDDYEEY